MAVIFVMRTPPQPLPPPPSTIAPAAPRASAPAAADCTVDSLRGALHAGKHGRTEPGSSKR